MDASRTERSEEEARGYTAKQRLINQVGVAAFLGLTLWQIVDLAEPARAVGPWWPALAGAGVLLALPFADFLSGFVHWAADNWGSGDWPILGGFVQPFRNHHTDPLGITRHGFLERHGDNCVASMPLFVVARFVGESPSARLFWASFFVATAYWIMATALCHAWAHMAEVPRWVRKLQDWRVILSPEHHDQHHHAPYNRNYCITTGWCDGPLRRLRFWKAMEWLVSTVTGATPLHLQGASHAEADVRDRRHA